MIGGLGTIDLQDWKTNTRLKHCTAESPQVIWFWRIVENYSEEMRARLLQFVTGSSRVPLQGFKALQVLHTMFLLAEFNTFLLFLGINRSSWAQAVHPSPGGGGHQQPTQGTHLL